MEIKSLKHAEDFLIEITKIESIKAIIDLEIATWEFTDCNNSLDVANINQLFHEFNKEVFLTENSKEIETIALHWLMFDKIHDICMRLLKFQFAKDDLEFFKKSQFLENLNISAKQFGVDEDLSIPLAAAIVELSILDSFKTPIEKMNCLCSTFDLIFAEIKTAMITVISQNSQRENEIPIINNEDVIPLLMIVIIKSKLIYFISNLIYIKAFHFQLTNKNRHLYIIFHSFEEAVEKLLKINENDLVQVENKIKKTLDLEEYILKSSEERKDELCKTLVDEANQRTLNLIAKATFDQ